MMGNQRQVLKNNIEKELVSKIEAAKDALSHLNKIMEINKQKSLNVKEEIRTTADAMKEILIQRKKDLIKEADNLHSMQTRSMQDTMRSIYITVGKLQGMLTNLDSFDQSQLIELQIPQVSMLYTMKEPTQINVTLDCDDIKTDLNEWGTVSADGFPSCTVANIPMTVPSLSSVTRTSTPAFGNANKENQIVPSKITAIRDLENCTWNGRGIQNWLSASNSRKNSTDNNNTDDFIIVSSPCSESDMDFVVAAQDMENEIETQVHEDAEYGSSIVCVKKDPEESDLDLSVWLKPKKLPKSGTVLPEKDTEFAMLKPNVVTVPVIRSSFSSIGNRSESSVGKRSLDFPCLKLEDENWVHNKKKVRPTNSIIPSIFKTNSATSTPPAYALPNPFWLKKYQQHRR